MNVLATTESDLILRIRRSLARRMGASEVLMKPFPRQKLIDSTQRVLG